MKKKGSICKIKPVIMTRPWLILYTPAQYYFFSGIGETF